MGVRYVILIWTHLELGFILFYLVGYIACPFRGDNKIIYRYMRFPEVTFVTIPHNMYLI